MERLPGSSGGFQVIIDKFAVSTFFAFILPEEHGRPITHWTAGKLKDQAVQHRILSSIVVRHFNRLLAAIDPQPHRSRYRVNAKPDPKKDGNSRTLCQVLPAGPNAASHGEQSLITDGMTGIQALARIAPNHPMQPGRPLPLTNLCRGVQA